MENTFSVRPQQARLSAGHQRSPCYNALGRREVAAAGNHVLKLIVHYGRDTPSLLKALDSQQVTADVIAAAFWKAINQGMVAAAEVLVRDLGAPGDVYGFTGQGRASALEVAWSSPLNSAVPLIELLAGSGARNSVTSGAWHKLSHHHTRKWSPLDHWKVLALEQPPWTTQLHPNFPPRFKAVVKMLLVASSLGQEDGFVCDSGCGMTSNVWSGPMSSGMSNGRIGGVRNGTSSGRSDAMNNSRSNGTSDAMSSSMMDQMNNANGFDASGGDARDCETVAGASGSRRVKGRKSLDCSEVRRSEAGGRGAPDCSSSSAVGRDELSNTAGSSQAHSSSSSSRNSSEFGRKEVQSEFGRREGQNEAVGETSQNSFAAIPHDVLLLVIKHAAYPVSAWLTDE